MNNSGNDYHYHINITDKQLKILAKMIADRLKDLSEKE